jgi:hypothetical protein
MYILNRITIKDDLIIIRRFKVGGYTLKKVTVL